MKKLIPDVEGFPNGCETVRFAACFVSMLMCAEGITEHGGGTVCVRENDDCIMCGAYKKTHEALYNHYMAVTGFGFLQIDLSNDDHMGASWNQTCNVIMLEALKKAFPD